MRDPEHKRARTDDRIAISELGCDLYLDGNACPPLDREAPCEPGVVGGAASDNDDPAHRTQALEAERTVRLRSDLGAHPRKRLRHGAALLVDLLEHEGLEAVLLARVHVPLNLGRGRTMRKPFDVEDRHPIGAQYGDLTVAEHSHLAGVRGESGDRRCDELLAVADPDNEWALATHTDERFRLIGAHRHERIVTFQIIERAANRIREIAVVIERDQVRDYLRVSVGAAFDQVSGEAGAQLEIVLDDAVEHDHEAAAGVGMGMRVLLGDATVRRPARVSDPGGDARRHRYRPRRGQGPDTARSRVGRQRNLERAEIADSAYALDLPILPPGDPSRVISTVLQAPEPLQQDILTALPADVADNPAHSCFSVRIAPRSRSVGCAFQQGRDAPETLQWEWGPIHRSASDR